MMHRDAEGLAPRQANNLSPAILPNNDLRSNSLHPPQAKSPPEFHAGEADKSAEEIGKVERAYQKAQETLEEAYETARKVRFEAISEARTHVEKTEEQSAELLSQAREHASQIRNQAEAEAAATMQRAQQEVNSLLTEARATHDRTLREAHDGATRMIEEARRQSEDTHNAAAAAMQEAIEYRNELQRLESQFEAVAREFAKWLGLHVDSDESFFRKIAREKTS